MSADLTLALRILVVSPLLQIPNQRAAKGQSCGQAEQGTIQSVHIIFTLYIYSLFNIISCFTSGIRF